MKLIEMVYIFSECLIGVKTIRTTCKSMADLLNKTNINCQPDQIIFVKEQSINFLGSDSQRHMIYITECKNSTSSKCFHQLAKNYISYFNISKSCNGKDKCLLGYNDMYNSAVKFANSCEYSHGTDLYLFRIGVSNECLNCTYSFDVLHVHVYYYRTLQLFQNISFFIHGL